MSEILVVGSLNMDLVVKAPRMPKDGETILGDDFFQIPGGKGGNQAVAIGRLGASVSMLASVGNDNFATELVTSLRESNVNCEGIKEKLGVSTGIALITLQACGENSIIVVPGANFSLKNQDIDQEIKLIKESELVLTQLEVPLDTVEYLLQKSKEYGKITVLNPAPAQNLSDEILKNIDYITPNETELEILTGIEVKNQEDLERACQKLLDAGVKGVIVTLGSKGAFFMDKTTRLEKSARKVEVVDTTAAGDSFTGAFCVGLVEGKSMDEILEFSCEVGSLTVQKMGAQTSLPTRKEVESI